MKSRNKLEIEAIEQDSMKAAFAAVGLDVLTLAKKHKEAINGTNATAFSKSMDMIHKIRGDYAVANEDNRPVVINLGFGDEKREFTPQDTKPDDNDNSATAPHAPDGE